MCSRLKKRSLFDIRLSITSTLSSVAWAYVFIKQPGYDFISIILSLFLANVPFLFFIIGVYLDKSWILSIIGIEDDHVASESKEISLGVAGGACASVVITMLGEGSDNILLDSSVVVLGIYFTSRMLTQVMGVCVYWIARLNDDTGLKTDISDELIVERLFKAASFNYRIAVLISPLLLIILVAYFFAESFFPLTSSMRARFVVYAILSFSWIMFSFILVHVFEKNAIWLDTSLQTKYWNEHNPMIEKSVRNQFTLTKFIFSLFLLIEVIIFFYCKNISMNS